jgi:transposase
MRLRSREGSRAAQSVPVADCEHVTGGLDGSVVQCFRCKSTLSGDDRSEQNVHSFGKTESYDADRLRRLAHDDGAVPVIPGRRNRKRIIRYDKQRYAGRHLIENAFCRLKDFRRVATRYDKLAAYFLSGVAIAIALTF